MNKLEKEAMGEGGEDDMKADIDEIIEASELVHNQVKEIRDALLMNRNPEDVDSDNEYVDGNVHSVQYSVCFNVFQLSYRCYFVAM